MRIDLTGKPIAPEAVTLAESTLYRLLAFVPPDLRLAEAPAFGALIRTFHAAQPGRENPAPANDNRKMRRGR